ncbi:MAG TPA: molybdenum cofactor guanylyltransferase [Acidisarcina sp.]
MNASGWVLAGGRSTRMGTDKTLLSYEGRPLIEIAVGKLQSLALLPRIVGRRSDLARFAPVVEDLRPGCGPLGGIEAALTVSDSDLNVFIPVDLPLLPSFIVQWMVARAELTRAEATIPLLQGRPQPLCCVLRRALLPSISSALDEGKFKVMPALTESGGADCFNVETVAPAQRDWLAEPPLHKWFQNINSPEDLHALNGSTSR